MDRSAVLTMVTGALVAVLFVVVASSGEVDLADRRPTIPFVFELPERDAFDRLDGLESDDGEEGESGAPSLVATVVQYVLLAGVMALLAYGAVAAWRNRPRLVWRRERRPEDFAALEAIAAAITAAADEQRATLDRGEARNAIVECWLRLELLVGSVGFPQDPSETATEFTARVLETYPIDPDAIFDLASLYREARFSDHEMGERKRQAAIDALDAIHRGVWQHVGTSVPT